MAQFDAFLVSRHTKPPRPQSFAFINSEALRDTLICILAASLSIAVGLLIRPHFYSQPSKLPEMTPAAHAPLSLAEFRKLIDSNKCVVLDAREDVLYDRGHVPGALSLPAGRFTACYAGMKSQIDSHLDQPIIVYCSGAQCDSSSEVQQKLKELGYEDVLIFRDGWAAWENAGYPREASQRAHLILPPWTRPS